MGPLAWILIGCGGLIVLVGILFVAGIGFVGYKAKQMASTPVETTAKIFAAANPDVDFVSADETTKTATFRNNKTGETVTLSLDDIKDGKMTIETPQGKLEVNAEGGENGQVEVKTADGKSVFQAGAGAAGNRPDWVPVYPGGTVQGAFAASGVQGSGGAFSVTAPDATASELYTFYKDQLQAGGFEVQEQSFSAGGFETRNLIAVQKNPNRTVNVTITTQDGRAQATIQYGEG